MTISFHSAAATVEHAFDTAIDRYRYATVPSCARRAGRAAPSSVAGCRCRGGDRHATGASARTHRPRSGRRPPDKAAAAQPQGSPVEGAPHACKQATAGASARGPHRRPDPQFLRAYGLYSEGDTGAGVHVGVFERNPSCTRMSNTSTRALRGERSCGDGRQAAHVRPERSLEEGPAKARRCWTSRMSPPPLPARKSTSTTQTKKCPNRAIVRPTRQLIPQLGKYAASSPRKLPNAFKRSTT